MQRRRPALFAATALALAGLGFGATTAWAAISYTQDFETVDNTNNYDWDGSGGITRVQASALSSPTTASGGSYYARITEGGSSDGGYTYNGGPVPTFLGPFAQSIDIYIDMDWVTTANDGVTGFKLNMYPANTSGSPNSAFGEQFLFNIIDDADLNTMNGVQVEAGGLGGSANDEGNDGNIIATITTSGWYTFETTFRKGATGTDSALADLAVYGHAGTLLGKQTRNGDDTTGHPDDSSLLGGNAYTWVSNWRDGFAGDTLAIDNVQTYTVPEPSSGALALLALGGLVMLPRRRKVTSW